MKKKIIVAGVIIILIVIFIGSKRMELSANEIVSGKVLQRRIGATFYHELSSAELKEFIDFFNGCNITDREHRKISESHTANSNSVDVALYDNEDRAIYYFMAFGDGEIYVNDEVNNKHYSL
ncbi:MAG TPA: hypothetical protein DC038_12670, partial [Clostridiales bacterium]|nr:hypothetical protein [Clostridiales bacterium]